MLLTSLPAFQRWGADAVSHLLEEKIGSRVSIGNLRLNMLGHIVLDNVELYDQRDTLMLQASRIAAKVNPIPLIEKKVRISGAQLIGAKAKLYKDGDEPCNFQFLIDAFSSKDTTSSPLNLGIGALVIRRGEVRFDHFGNQSPTAEEGVSSATGKLNLNHLNLTDLNLTARIMLRVPDTLSFELRGLSFREASGLCLKQLTFEVGAGKNDATISNFLLQLPETEVSGQCTMVEGQWTKDNGRWALVKDKWSMNLEASICPKDLTCLVSQLENFGDIVNVSSEGELSMAESQCSVENLYVRDSRGNFSLLCDASVSDLQGTPSCFADIRELRTGQFIQQYLVQNLQLQPKGVLPILGRLGSTKSSGTLAYENGSLLTNIQTKSEQGAVSVDATLRNMRELQAAITATEIRLGHLLELSGDGKGMMLSLEADMGGTLPAKDRQAKLSLTGLLNNLTYNNYEHRNIPFSVNVDGNSYSGELAMEEPNGTALLHLQTGKQQGKQTLQCRAQLTDFALHDMNLTKRYEGERFCGTLDADFSNIDPNNLQGELHLTNMELVSETKGNLKVGDIEFTSNVEEDGMHIRLSSDYLRARADGHFNWKSLPASFLSPIRQNLPSFFLTDGKHSQPSGNDFRFVILVRDTLLAERLLDTDLRLPTWSWLDGDICDPVGQIALQLRVPQVQLGGQQMQNITCRTEAGGAALQTSLQCERIMKDKPVELNFDAYAKEDKVTSRLRWDNKRDIAHTGDISMTALIRRDLSSQTAIDAKMNASRVVIGDTLWHIEPAIIKYHDKVVDVENLSISQAHRHVNIGGRLSDLASDTLKAELADINIAYIMDLVNFHKVDFDGKVTGSIYATSLMKKPSADAFLQVKNFTFNAANLGDMDLYANWGRQERAIMLEADMRGPFPQHQTQVHGTIIPGKGERDGLNLNIQTNHIDLSFLNKYTKNIFRDLQGRASGWARVFGPFKVVNLEGDLFINEMKTHVLSLGTDYHVTGDSVILRPDNIWLNKVRVYDNQGMPGMTEHVATVDAHMMHDAFKTFEFDINIDARNILGYNFPHQGSMNFYGIAYADAQVHLAGNRRETNIDVNVTPMPGTILNYNTAVAGTVSGTEFVTYGPIHTSADGGLQSLPTDGKMVDDQWSGANASPSDLRINFDINANPNAQLRLLMDARTGDNIALHGRGRLRANYYNKGRFQLYGTYRVTEGTYQLSIRDLIRKNFTFKPDGTIVFGGDAMQASLNLKATHTVPNVSLDDLSTTGLGLSNTRVDCIMSIGGIARDPSISFDFDIPNANEDEKQMVRSMLSSEEERDMQAIYLLGVGRFYTYGSLLEKGQTKSTMAVNSVLSSTLSARFNQIMSQVLGGTGWTFGTNLRTGEAGWEHLDAEALVSGKMLSGRLQFNGNFGYRENKYKLNGNNFIGDFDIQYRLSPRSPFSLKAYNQTNDRYFTQSSLTTQGVGIKFQRDFTHWLEIFRRTKRK